MPVSALAERDPEGKTLLSAKMSFVGGSDFALEATGPGEDEYMLPELIKFIWEYVSSGCLEVTEGLEGAEESPQGAAPGEQARRSQDV